jgi:hypothetical protein
MIRCPSCGKQSYATEGKIVAVRRVRYHAQAIVRCLDCGHRWKSTAAWVPLVNDATEREKTADAPVWRTE